MIRQFGSNWAIVETVREIAQEIEQSPARVALSWVTRQPGVTSVLMGASRPGQVADNVAALDVELSEKHMNRLADASNGDRKMLYGLFTPALRRQVIFGGHSVDAWAG